MSFSVITLLNKSELIINTINSGINNNLFNSVTRSCDNRYVKIIFSDFQKEMLFLLGAEFDMRLTLIFVLQDCGYTYINDTYYCDYNIIILKTPRIRLTRNPYNFYEPQVHPMQSIPAPSGLLNLASQESHLNGDISSAYVESSHEDHQSQIINNDILPRNPLEHYELKSSFDERNLLKKNFRVRLNESIDDRRKFTTNEAPSIPLTVKRSAGPENNFLAKYSSSRLEDLEAARKILINKPTKFQSFAKKTKDLEKKHKLKRGKKLSSSEPTSMDTSSRSLISTQDSKSSSEKTSAFVKLPELPLQSDRISQDSIFGMQTSVDKQPRGFFAAVLDASTKQEDTKPSASEPLKFSFFNPVTSAPSLFFQSFSTVSEANQRNSTAPEQGNSNSTSFWQQAVEPTTCSSIFESTSVRNIPDKPVSFKSVSSVKLPKPPNVSEEASGNENSLGACAKFDGTRKEQSSSGWPTPYSEESGTKETTKEQKLLSKPGSFKSVSSLKLPKSVTTFKEPSNKFGLLETSPKLDDVRNKKLHIAAVDGKERRTSSHDHLSDEPITEKRYSQQELNVICEEIVVECIQNFLLNICQEVIEKEKLRQEQQNICDELVAQCVHDYLVDISREVLENEKTRQNQLSCIYEEIKRNLIKKTILKWQHFCERKRQRRQFQKSTLCSPWQPLLINTPYAVTGVVSPMTVYKKQQSLSRLTAEKIKKRHETIPGWEVYSVEELSKTNKVKVQSPAYFGNSKVNSFFKLCLVLPSGQSDHDLHFSEWLCAKFGLPKPTDIELSACKLHMSDEDCSTIAVSVVALKLDAFNGTCCEHCLDGISAMVLCASQSSLTQEFLEHFALLLDLDTLMYPYALLVCQTSPQAAFEGSVNFSHFLKEKTDAGYFSNTKINCISDVYCYLDNSSQILDSLNWLHENQCVYPNLQYCVFQNYLEDAFTSVFNMLFCKMSLTEYEFLRIMPNQIMQLYNKVFEFRASVLSSELVQRLSSSWPPKELSTHLDGHFINISSQTECADVIRKVLLPPYQGHADGTGLWDYIDTICTLSDSDNDVLVLRIKNALENSSSSPDWTVIISICALHLISTQPVEYFSNEKHVFYTKEDLETFECDDFWQNVLMDIRNLCISSIKRKEFDVDTESPAKKTKLDELGEDSLSSDLEESDIEDYLDISEIPEAFSQQKSELLMPLQIALEKQKEESEAFLHLLSSSIGNGEYDRDESSLRGEEDEMNISSLNCVENLVDVIQDKSLNESSDLNISDIDFLHKSVLEKSTTRNSLSSMADSINELKYNIQKNSILEDHFNRLLSNQV